MTATTITPLDRSALGGPDRFEQVLGWGALAMLAAILAMLAAILAMLAAILAAVARAPGHWREPPSQVWVHLLTVIVALGLTPVMLWSARGTPRH